MERKVFLCKYLILVMIVLGKLNGFNSCIKVERKALMELKTYLALQGSKPDFNTFDFILITWTNDTTSDCCMWEGIMCNLTSRRVIGLSLLESMFLPDWPFLNLSLLHPFQHLQTLNLSGHGYHGFRGFFDHLEGHNSLKKLRNLKSLDFTLNGFNNSVFPFLNAATSLTSLFLRRNNLDGSFPVQELKDLTKLELLDLSTNRFNGSIPELSVFKNLKALDLSRNEFSAPMGLQGICELKNLQELDISSNNLGGQFPLCLTNLTGLRVLDLASNFMTGKLPSALRNLESLQYLSLFDNDFEGFFSLSLLANFSELKVLKLYSKSNSLLVDSDGSWTPKFQLNVITLRSCNLEKVPQFLLYQKDLLQVDLSGNKISEAFPSWLLMNNTKLEILLLGNNSFTSFQLPETVHNLLFLDLSVNEFNHIFPENIGWILLSLRFMNLAKNSFLGNLPSSLGNMKRLEFLDISHNRLHGNIPRSFLNGCYSMRILKLSYNKLSGEIFPESANFTYLYVLSLDNNLFTGNIGKGLRSVRSLSLLDVSNNNLTGLIPNWIGEFEFLYAFLISNNSFEGKIPISLFNISSLKILDLSANNLSGDLPPNVSSTSPVVLLLQNNNLSGIIPETLLVNVTILDLRFNRLSGEIPEFINTQNISILLLRGNDLTGGISHQLCGLNNIHLLDLAKNRLNGYLPSCLSKTSFSLKKEETTDYYDLDFGYIPHDVFTSSNTEQDVYTTGHIGQYFKSLLVLDPFVIDFLADTETRIEFAAKHRYDAYRGGNLLQFFGLDLSENELSGEIPVELGDLLELHALNLSHNFLSGSIPVSFSDLKNIESLDLSFNRLQDSIPLQLTELSSLAVFNVSYNNLSGVIPRGKQFNTFDIRSYIDNPLLCGLPTNKSCETSNLLEPDTGIETDESFIDMVSFYWSFVVANVMILIGILASLSFDSPWSRAWFHVVDSFIYKVRSLLS